MKRAAAGLVAFGLIVVGGGSNAGREATAAPTASASGPLAGYQPVSDVSGHARMSADVCDINGVIDATPIDFAAVGAIYRDGKNSTEASGAMRTLAKFAREPRSSEDLLGRYERSLGAGWLDAFAAGAIDGTGAFAGEADLVRRQGVQKGVRDQILVAWSFHELDSALQKAGKGDFADATGAPHNWDEARAYYHGEKPACAPYATAEERGKEFGTGSAVNQAILAAMNRGLAALQARDAAGAAKARDEVVRQVTITYLQSALKYAAQIDADLARGKPDDARIWQAEGWAYFRVIEPLVAQADPAAARAVVEVYDLKSKPAPGSGEKVAGALSRAYGKLGIRASEVGTYRPPGA